MENDNSLKLSKIFSQLFEIEAEEKIKEDEENSNESNNIRIKFSSIIKNKEIINEFFIQLDLISSTEERVSKILNFQ